MIYEDSDFQTYIRSPMKISGREAGVNDAEILILMLKPFDNVLCLCYNEFGVFTLYRFR